MKELKKWKWGCLALTVAVMLLGVCLVIWPGISAEILCYLFGSVLLIVGAVRVVSYFQRGIGAIWHRYELPVGLLDALLGVYFFTRPANVLSILPILAGIAIVVDSVCKLQTALELRELGSTKWRRILVFSILSILAGIFLIRNPFEGTLTLMVFVGLSLVLDSVQSLFFIRSAAKEIRKRAPIEAEYMEVE